MQLSQTAEYALRAVVWLAEHPSDAQTAQQIADGCKVPVSYLSKVLQPLTRVGLVSAQRGLGGGYVLERHIDQISLLDVVNAVEPVQRIHSCPLKLASHGAQLCALHQSLDSAMAAIEQRFSQITIGQLLSEPTGVRPLCESTGTTPLKVSARRAVEPAPQSRP